ncbi:MAG: hypothetical protein ABI650_03950 [Dokdonella sp.]
MRTATKIVAIAVLAVACRDALALRLDYTVELGLLHSDNINLSATDPITETVLIPRLDFSISESSSRVQAAVTGALEHRSYLDNTYGGEFRGTLNGLVNWTMVPERLNWVFADNLGLYPISLRAADVPGNLQQTNVFTTGPTLRFRLAPTLQGQAELRYIDSYAEETSAFDSSRVSAAFRVLQQLSPTRRLSANVEAQEIDFDDDLLANDYARYSAFAGFTQTLSSIDLDAALGYSYLEFDRGDNTSGPLARARMDWRATERSVFGLGASWQYSDAATSLAAGSAAFDPGLGGIGIGGAMISPDVYRERRVDGSYAFRGVRLNLVTTLYAATFRYEQDTLMVDADRDEVGAGVNLGYLLRPSMTLGVAAEAIRRNFDASDALDRDFRYGIYFAQQLARHWRWRVDLSHYERNADEGAESFDENSAFVRFAYTR